MNISSPPPPRSDLRPLLILIRLDLHNDFPLARSPARPHGTNCFPKAATAATHTRHFLSRVVTLKSVGGATNSAERPRLSDGITMQKKKKNYKFKNNTALSPVVKSSSGGLVLPVAQRGCACMNFNGHQSWLLSLCREVRLDLKGTDVPHYATFTELMFYFFKIFLSSPSAR